MVPGDAFGQRQAIYSAIGGVLFGAGWWAFIDGFNMGMNVKGASDGGISATASGYRGAATASARTLCVVVVGFLRVT